VQKQSRKCDPPEFWMSIYFRVCRLSVVDVTGDSFPGFEMLILSTLFTLPLKERKGDGVVDAYGIAAPFDFPCQAGSQIGTSRCQHGNHG
jgi:hypothetical protein